MSIHLAIQHTNTFVHNTLNTLQECALGEQNVARTKKWSPHQQVRERHWFVKVKSCTVNPNYFQEETHGGSRVPSKNPNFKPKERQPKKKKQRKGCPPLGVSLLRKTETDWRKKGVSLNGGGNMRGKTQRKRIKENIYDQKQTLKPNEIHNNNNMMVEVGW